MTSFLPGDARLITHGACSSGMVNFKCRVHRQLPRRERRSLKGGSTSQVDQGLR